MALAPKRPCAAHSCAALIRPPARYCARHAGIPRQQDAARGTAAERGYDQDWRIASRAFRRRNPLCGQQDPDAYPNPGPEMSQCKLRGRTRAATCVHHKRGAVELGISQRAFARHPLFRDRRNWQAACDECHNSHTASTQGFAAK